MVFVNKNICINVLLVSAKRIKAFTLIILIIHIIVSYDQNISLIFYAKMDPISGCDIQGYNARKVISEVYASFVLQRTVSGR